MRILYPNDPSNPKAPDEPYVEEYDAVRAAGLSVALFSFEDFERGEWFAKPAIAAGDAVLYRGWMLPVDSYARLVQTIEAREATAVTSAAHYRECHHLPQWYPSLKEFTAETLIFSAQADFERELQSVSWPGYFVKDYVKSLTTRRGSMAKTPAEIADIVASIGKYRGTVEGGVCIRRLEDYEAESERRYFVFRGRPFAPDGNVPELVRLCAERIESPFFSVDVARRTDGVLRLIEVGDGQVSGRKEWPVDAFVKMLCE